MEKPLFTIVTATYNAASTLGTLLESCAKQTYQNFELIIQDGASSDNTLAIAHAFSDRIPRLKIFSEPDTGIYDAWNKGLSMAEGAWVVFLGADDIFANSNVLFDANEMLVSLPSTILFAAGDAEIVNANGQVLQEFKAQPSESERILKFGCPVSPAALFYRKDFLIKHKFNKKYKYASDYDFLCSYFKFENAVHLPFVVTRLFSGGVTTNPKTRLRTALETLRISKEHFGVWNPYLIINCLKAVLHGAINMIFGDRLGNVLYDKLRLLNGKAAFWSKNTTTEKD